MSSMSNSPYQFKGALCQGPIVIPFQYNPETLTRSLTANSVDNTQGTNDCLRLKSAPTETIELQILLDAASESGIDKPGARFEGILPHLSALELLVYPASSRVIANEVLAQLGFLEIIPPFPIPTILVWGAQRVVPVRITGFSIVEEIFNPNLNPIRARINLSLQVLTYSDLGLLSVGGMLSMANQLAKEALAITYQASSDPSMATSLYHTTKLGVAAIGKSSGVKVASKSLRKLVKKV